MRSKILVMSAAALLAGTMMAAGQGMQRQGPAGGSAPENGAGAAGQMQNNKERGGSTQLHNQGPASDKRAPGQAQRESSPPKTTGQAPRGDEDRNQAKDRDQNHNRAQERTQGQNQNSRDRVQERTQGQSQRDRDQGRTQGQNQRDQNRTLGQGAASSGGSVNLTTEQRTKIRQTVLTGSAPRVEHVDFSVNVGTVVPRTVRIVEVPPTLVEIHPDWRGFRYFVYNDEIIIVEPDTLKIVAVVTV